VILKTADDKAHTIAALEQLKEGAPPSIVKRIDQEIRNIRAGAAGERNAAHFINREFGRSERVAVLHDLRLRVGTDFAQIDHLLIHAVQARAWVLETKNFSGRLSCDEHGDWTVWRNQHPRSIPSPVNQARRQSILLSRWFEAAGVPGIEVIPTVLISPTTSVNRKHLADDARIIKSDNFPDWLRKEAEGIDVFDSFRMVAGYFWNGRSGDWLQRLGRRLVRAHRPIEFDWPARFGLAKAESAVVKKIDGGMPVT
jgi:hypothetical protein